MSTPEAWLRLSLGFVWMLGVSITFLLVALLLLPWRILRVKACNIYGTLVGKPLVWIVGARTKLYNPERLNPKRPALYVSNHTSTIDMWLGMWICPMGGVGLAKKEISKVPGIGQLYLLSGHPMIDRSNREKAIATLSEVSRFVNRNRLSLWIWPEGTRSKDGALQPFKKGFAHMAIACGIPIVPIVVWNATAIWPRGPVRLSTGDLHVGVLEPIDTSNWTTDNIDNHVNELRDVFQSALAAGPPATQG